MKQKQQVIMRMEFLEVGDKLGFPRIGYGPGKRVKPGEAGWTAFAAKAPVQHLAPALRNARILSDYYGGAIPEGALPSPPDPQQAARERMARARAGKAARAAERRALQEATA